MEGGRPSRGRIRHLLGVLVVALLVGSLAVVLRDAGQPDHALSFAAPSGPAPA